MSEATHDRRRAVFDVNVLVGAVAGGNSPFRGWPSPPPVSDNPNADCLGVVNDAREFSLCLSEHVLVNTARVLAGPGGLGWASDITEGYVGLLVEIAEASGCGVLEPEVLVADCVDPEDNKVLEPALSAGADLIVSADKHLLDLSPWRGIPILTPRDFVSRVDAMRRAARRRDA